MPAIGLALLVPMLIKIAPALVREGVNIYTKIKKTPKPKPSQETAQTETIHALMDRVTGAEDRLEALEGHTEAQAELMVKLTRHNQTLSRWVFVLAAVATASAGVATAALLLTLWQ